MFDHDLSLVGREASLNDAAPALRYQAVAKEDSYPSLVAALEPTEFDSNGPPRSRPATGTWMAANAVHLAARTERFPEADAAFKASWTLAQRLQSPFSVVVIGVAYADVLGASGRVVPVVPAVPVARDAALWIG